MKKFDSISLYFKYSKLTVRAWFQYRVDAVIRSLAVFLREGSAVIAIYLTLLAFTDINGWNISEMMFLFSLLFVTYGIFIIFFTGLRNFSGIIKKGEFDKILLRPRGALFQVIVSDTDWFAALGHGVLGIVLFILSANNVGIVWNFKNIVYYIFSILGGVLIQGSIFLFLASLCFFVVEVKNLQDLIYWNARKMANYPISIYNKIIQYLLIIIPFAFVNYFPAQFLLNKSDMTYPKIFLYLTPLIGATLYFLAYLFWRFSLKHYKSTGN